VIVRFVVGALSSVGSWYVVAISERPVAWSNNFEIEGFAAQIYAISHNFCGEGPKGPDISPSTTLPDPP
jgi:hypothetical protein